MLETLSRRTTKSARLLRIHPAYFNKKVGWLGLFLAGVGWALYQAGLFQGQLINPGGWPLAARFLQAALQPELSGQFLQLTGQATLVTLAFAVCGIFLSLILGVGGGILASEVWWQSLVSPQRQALFRGPWLAFRSLLASLRAVHEIIWGLIFVNIIGLDPLSAILAIAIPFGAITAKVYSEILDETPRHAFTALRNSGASTAKAFAYTLLPQALRDWLSYGFYHFECAIRAAAVLGIIGAGGLGHQIFLSFQTLKYQQIWTLFYALFLLNGLVDFCSSLLRRRLGRQINCSDSRDWVTINRPGGRSGDPPGHDPALKWSLVMALLLIPFSFWYVQPDYSRLVSARTWQNLLTVLQFSLPPDFAVVGWSAWLELAQTTLAMSLLAVAGAGLVGLFFSFPAANNFLLPGGLLDLGRGSKWQAILGTVILLLTRFLLLVWRSIPPPIWALIFLFVLFPGILPGAMALGLYTLGVLGRLMAEVTENLDDRPLTALKSQGAGGGQLFSYGVLPTTMPRFIAYFLYRWEETIRATVVIGLVGAGGLGWLLLERLSAFDYQGVAAALLVFVAIIFVVDLISAAARRAFREG